MIAAQEASVMLNLAMQVRNKLVEGYQEITRISM
jgi:flagellar hook-basal body complex protein FliE